MKYLCFSVCYFLPTYLFVQYIVIALILCWHSIHVAVINFNLIKFGNLILRLKDSSVAHAVFGRFLNDIPAFHVILFKYLFDNEMMTQILVKTRKPIGKEVHQRHRKTNFIWFELQNKQSPVSVHKLQWPPNP